MEADLFELRLKCIDKSYELEKFLVEGKERRKDPHIDEENRGLL